MTRFASSICAVIVLASVFSLKAFAAPESTSVAQKTSDEKIAEFKSVIHNRLRIGLSVNSATKMEGLSYRRGDATLATGTANTDSTQALELTWVNRLYEGPDATKFDWFAGMTIERERSVSSLNVKAVGSDRPAQTFVLDSNAHPTFHATLLSAGIRWTPNQLIYVPLGFNYGFRADTVGGGTDTFDLESKLGVQAGAGLHLSPNFEVEAVYKVVRYDVNYHGADFKTTGESFSGSVDLSGLTVGARYIF